MAAAFGNVEFQVNNVPTYQPTTALIMFQFVSVSKSYGKKPVLVDVDLTIPRDQTTVLIGPSGSGKSTLLGIMAGLLEPQSGEILFDGLPISHEALPMIRQRLGYVIQDGGLFPHLTGLANAALMARYLGWNENRIAARVRELADLTRLPFDLLNRYPSEMSGGQRQRVSLIRALMLEPEVLLLDEPLGALDPMIRASLQHDLLAIFRRLRKTVTLVTHDLAEAAYFADQIVLMHEGHLIQKGNLNDLVHNPVTPFVTEFVRAQQNHLGREISL
jgi:osmoprotectant transport system ATP-binding protein